MRNTYILHKRNDVTLSLCFNCMDSLFYRVFIYWLLWVGWLLVHGFVILRVGYLLVVMGWLVILVPHKVWTTLPVRTPSLLTQQLALRVYQPSWQDLPID